MIVNTMGHIQKLKNIHQHQLLEQLSIFKETVFFSPDLATFDKKLARFNKKFLDHFDPFTGGCPRVQKFLKIQSNPSRSKTKIRIFAKIRL